MSFWWRRSVPGQRFHETVKGKEHSGACNGRPQSVQAPKSSSSQAQITKNSLRREFLTRPGWRSQSYKRRRIFSKWMKI